MIIFKTPIMKVDFNYNGNIISEEAALSSLTKFKKMPLFFGNSKAVIGSIDFLEYNKESKELIATITLNAQLNIMFSNTNALKLPEGNRILDTEIRAAMFELMRPKDDRIIS